MQNVEYPPIPGASDPAYEALQQSDLIPEGSLVVDLAPEALSIQDRNGPDVLQSAADAALLARGEALDGPMVRSEQLDWSVQGTAHMTQDTPVSELWKTADDIAQLYRGGGDTADGESRQPAIFAIYDAKRANAAGHDDPNPMQPSAIMVDSSRIGRAELTGLRKQFGDVPLIERNGLSIEDEVRNREITKGLVEIAKRAGQAAVRRRVQAENLDIDKEFADITAHSLRDMHTHYADYYNNASAFGASTGGMQDRTKEKQSAGYTDGSTSETPVDEPPQDKNKNDEKQSKVADEPTPDSSYIKAEAERLINDVFGGRSVTEFDDNELRRGRRIIAFQAHPDRGGDQKVFQEVNARLDDLASSSHPL